MHFFIIYIIFCFASISFALTINVDGQSQILENTEKTDNTDNSKATDKSTAISSSKIAYVDMEKAFTEHPLSSRAKEDFTVEVEKRKNELLGMENDLLKLESDLKAKETEIKDMQGKIDLLKTEPSVAVNTSTSSLSSSTAKISTTSVLSSDKMNDLLKSTDDDVKTKQEEYKAISLNIEKKKAEIADKNKKNKDELCALEECKSAEVLKDIFLIVNKIAQEEGIEMIIDKNDVLFAQPYQDITEKVLDRMRGR